MRKYASSIFFGKMKECMGVIILAKIFFYYRKSIILCAIKYFNENVTEIILFSTISMTRKNNGTFSGIIKNTWFLIIVLKF